MGPMKLKIHVFLKGQTGLLVFGTHKIDNDAFETFLTG